MITLRKSEDRGYAHHGWLKSHHTFSFANYYDPEHMGFRSLRVINEDYIEGGQGFGAHPHRDMEIITYVVKGSLEHQDSMGTKAEIRPGEVQYMSAGSGIVHSEYNKLADQETHLLQIWIQPDRRGGSPTYGQKSFEAELNSKKLVLVVSNDGREGSIKIRQDADLYVSRLKAGDALNFHLREGRGLWLQVIKGRVTCNDKVVAAGDALAVEEAQNLQLKAQENSEFLLFDLA